ncbi:hypothetical protein WB66_00015 [bacteria symbiont BFo1 of Frankliniella occidentalis]|nr:hypothetical protein WB66_00015 [bacteria symbiont BFo1 of Frankliniella occidentalis]KYP92675.1 hypothetical protein WB91_00245 [bacteria symbiont BFo1 of Frankliniella occidentalis]
MLGISVSSVSKRLVRLEEHLQTTLLERNTHGVRLSPIGKKAYLRSKEITNDFSNFIEEIRGGESIQININLEKGVSSMPIVDWVYDYAIAPLSFKFEINSSVRIKSQLLDINNVVISSTKSTYPYAIHRKLEPIERTICVGMGYQSKVTIDALSAGKIVFYSGGDNDLPILTNNVSGETKTMQPIIVTDDITQVISLIERNEMIALGIPEYLAKKFNSKGILRTVSLDWSLHTTQYYLIWKRRKFYNKGFQDFLNFIERRFNEFVLT